MLSIADHRSRILSQVTPLGAIEAPLRRARGLVLAEELRSAVDLPGFDNSGMDGYAVLAADVAGASASTPVMLPVDGDITAGTRQMRSIAPGRTMRIMTGAPVPIGADAVVPVEHTDGGVASVVVHRPAEPGRHIRPAGQDIRRGDVLFERGDVFGVRHLALAAAAGRGQVHVHPRPRVLVVSTGDELVPVGSVPGFGEVVDSNGAMLEAVLDSCGYESARSPGATDTRGAVLSALADGVAAGCDAVVTTGGVSMGAYDAVKAALGEHGVRFDQVAMMPGKPQGFGLLDLPGSDSPTVPVFTLPGNPVSAYVSFHVFVLPALQRMAGAEPAGLPVARVRVRGEPPPTRERTQYLRVRLHEADDGLVATVPQGQSSHMLRSLADADGLLIVPATDDPGGPAEPGDAGVGSYDCLVLIDGHHVPAEALARPARRER